ncbi:MAG: helix-turn-helix transcriptional regulator [Clostridiales bacterium]|nr:helix-turn-helix transcriptional regulator [Clostridiales bacterium]
MQLTDRQLEIIEIVKKDQPITSENIAVKLNLSRSALRNDLSLLNMIGILEAKTNVGYFYVEKNLSSDLKDLLSNVTVDSVMSIPVVMDEKIPVYDGVVSMFIEDVGTLFVVSDGYLAGVVSRKDFMKNIMGTSDLTGTPLGMIMTRMPNIIYAYPLESVCSAASKLINHEIDSMPVIEKVLINGEEKLKIIGRISKTTITRIFVDLVDGHLGGNE